jgi:hypothetical protein
MMSIVSMLSVNNAIFYKPKDRAIHAEAAMKNFFRPNGISFHYFLLILLLLFFFIDSIIINSIIILLFSLFFIYSINSIIIFFIDSAIFSLVPTLLLLKS